jgi:formylglycine-generating enzyme required for sulfatase activity
MQIAAASGDFAPPEYEGSDFAAHTIVPVDANLSVGAYQWRVKARPTGGVWPERWSDPAAFSLTAPDLGTISPADGATTSDTTPLLDWEDVEGAASYEVQIAGTAEALAAATAVAASESSYEVPLSSVFAYGDAGSWRARSVNGQLARSAWSAAFGFGVEWAVDYGTISPPDGGVTSNTTPLLEWGDVPGAASYALQIADSAAGVANAAAVGAPQSQYQVPEALSYGTWHWRVRPINADGVPAGWSATFRFTVDRLLAMVPVPGGTFVMGSTTGFGDELPLHSVTISGFAMAAIEVTQAQYQAIANGNPSYFLGDTSRPVEWVSFYDAVAFCNALSAAEGLESCYSVSGTDVACDFSKNGYRLPTEAEWEYAAKGGAASQGTTYAGSNDLDAVAWYSGNSGGTTHPVAGKQPNELGLYDMTGNVWEWCWDWSGGYIASPQTDPTGPSNSDGMRDLRGGCWADVPNAAPFLRVSARNRRVPETKADSMGFRPVRRP